VRFAAADLASWDAHEEYDLVTASFLQSPVELPRAQVLRAAAGRVAQGGHLLLLTHAAPPPWAREPMHHHEFLTPQEEVDRLDLDPGAWTVAVAETRERQVTDPDGQAATLLDAVVLLRRR
ncbi:methyltransferase, partial [Cellulomonas bogoriensis 69B4 = DSM 16987]